MNVPAIDRPWFTLVVENGKANLRADSFTSLLREEVPAYPVYVPPRRKGLNDMSVEELFELASHFRRSKRSQDAIMGSGAYDVRNEVARYKVMDREKEKRRLQTIMLFGREAVDIPSEVKSLKRPPSPVTPPAEFDQLIEELEERQNFLDQMKSMGRESFYREKISQEVVEILNRMRLVNKEKYNQMMEQADKDWNATAYHSVLKNNIY
ncbi:hypothetical protein RvY_00535 [Ramazzottius varieornatus]|uniref:Uncharacterized protein n=1 Tax=Ramazzottius varieornatus TaxID=947166 RepID=A0A1D1UD49_RAMVA|nr:hypothetical protein RvY_00535 [Ramazzottius varieornatus]